MIDLKKCQKDIYDNKVNKGFNVTDLKEEFLYLYGEVGEAYSAYIKKKDDLPEELADVMIYVLGIAEILGIDMEKAVEHKMYKNSKREYKIVDGIGVRTKEYEPEEKQEAN